MTLRGTLLIATLTVGSTASAQDLLHLFEAPEANMGFGHVVDGAGDVDGDGHADVVVSALVPLGYPWPQPGRVFVFSGRTGEVLVELADEGDFGYALAGVGDQDGDGAGDIVIGVPGAGENGEVRLVSGRDGALLWTITGNQYEQQFGWSVAGGGHDVNGDGWPEFTVAPRTDTGTFGDKLPPIARSYSFQGKGTGMIAFATRAVTVADVDADGLDDFLVMSAAEHLPGVRLLTSPSTASYEYPDLYGWVAALGDVDGDGVSDFGVGDAPKRVVIKSGATGEGIAIIQEPFSTFPELPIDDASDLDGDGRDDVIVGAARMEGNGAAFVFSGDGRRLRSFFGPHERSEFGWSVANAGDVDDDGVDDIVVGAPSAEVDGVPSGAVYVFSGLPTWTSLGGGLAGLGGVVPELRGEGELLAQTPVELRLVDARPSAGVTIVVGLDLLGLPFRGGTLVPSPDLVVSGFATGSAGTLTLTATWPGGVPGETSVYMQAWIDDPDAVMGSSASNGLRGVTP